MATKAGALADAIKDWINGGTYATSFTADRRWAPRLDKRSLGTLEVSVITTNRKRQLVTRGNWQDDSSPIVTVTKSVDHTSNDDCDSLMLLCEQIEDRMWASDAIIADGVRQRLIATEIDVAQDMLWEDRIFAGYIECQMRAVV